MTRLLGNVRTLDVFPCGGCGAYVPRNEGCEHYSPPDPKRVRTRDWERTRTRAENPARFNDMYGIMRLADSHRMRDILGRAVSGAPLVLAERNDRHTANALMRAGLLTQEMRGRPYHITDAGRDVWQRVLALGAGT